MNKNTIWNGQVERHCFENHIGTPKTATLWKPKTPSNLIIFKFLKNYFLFNFAR